MRETSVSPPAYAAGGSEPKALASRARFSLSGFTLIEIVVVMLVLSIILGMVSVRLTRDQSDILRDEAQRLALVLQNAQQQAILEGRYYAFAASADGYQFLSLNKDGRLVPIRADELLGPRKLPAPMTLDPDRPAADATKRPDPLLFDPSGEFPAFTMILSIGDLTWYVQGRDDGQIQSTPIPPAAT